MMMRLREAIERLGARTRLRVLAPLFVLASLVASQALAQGAAPPAPASAPAPPSVAGSPPAHAITSIRSWTAPANTRVVFDLTEPVDIVAPDSGVARALAVTIPRAGLVLASGVPALLGVKDGVVDSVSASVAPEGVTLRLWLRDTTFFRVFTLPAEDDKPYRIVVDVARPGAAAAEQQRLDSIAVAKKQHRLRVVAVDAGHGGEDTGARGPGRVYEKNVTLAVAKALVDELNQIQGIKAVLTRDGDYFIPLRDRYHRAEQMKADVFISIHCNSSRRRGSGRGTEVYFLSLKGASDQADADLADAENAADLVGGVPPQSENDLVNILYDVKRSSMLTQSQLLAESLLDNLATDRKLESRGIKQAGFVVLKSVEFPSVLVETAFINNPFEVRLLKDPKFQKRLAKQISSGVRDYFGRAGVPLPKSENGKSEQSSGF